MAARTYLVLSLTLLCCAVAPLAGGLSGSVVQSGSMQPHIDPGDVVLTAPLGSDDEPPLGRVVMFEAPEGSAYDGLVLHRIVAINPDSSLVTQGDANAVADSVPLAQSDVLARAILLVPFIGLPALWVGAGDLLPLTVWVVLTLGALLIEGTRVFQGRGRHRSRSRRSSAAPVLSTVSLRVPPLVIAIALAVAATSVWGGTDAAFTAQTVSAGNTWAMAAPGAPAKLAFERSPSGSTGGVAFSTQPTVVVQDTSGRTVTTSTAPITLQITNAAGAVLSCATNPLTAAAGRATFSGCSITTSGTYTLTARSGSLAAAVSSSFVIATGPAARLQFTAQPSTTVVSNVNLAVQPRVTVQDAGGNTVTSSVAPVTLALSAPNGATLSCTTNPKAAVSGIAQFAGCKVNLTGTYTLTATSGALSAATSTSFSVTPGAATKVTFRTSPTNTSNSAPFSSQPVVLIQDAAGNTVTTSSSSVTLTITGSPGGANLTCSANPRPATAGVATFSGCSINKKGTYTLRATSGQLTAGTSASFSIT